LKSVSTTSPAEGASKIERKDTGKFPPDIDDQSREH